ncbi:MAG: hypothetical protein LKF82_13700 [Acinetobacter populi]|jgi:hypothetical protein|uniref:hypothetical protein n=1 Tax=Acinetobacter populi TaxID=1582270 RepID=UPI002355393D|nr:hypothetical protein [Acinetobacter populi]MCH4248860.1 hypothetical protein [Acinetobacter populi]
MNDPKQLIEMAQQYGARLKRIDDQQIKVTNGQHLPPEFIEQLRANKSALLKYLEQSFFDAALQRAYHGYFWLLEQKQQQCRYNRQPLSDAHISVQEWRQSIADVIGLNPCEVQTIENLLINSRHFRYYWNDRYIMSIAEYANDDDYHTIYEFIHAPSRAYLAS